MSEVDALLERLAVQLDERQAVRGRGRRPAGAPDGRRAWRRRPDLGHTARLSTEIIVYILTVLAAVVVVLTRLRLGQAATPPPASSRSAGGCLLLHTASGAVALVLWVVFLAFPRRTRSSAARWSGSWRSGFFWLTAIVGLLILMRWLPTRGKHAVGQRRRQLERGPGVLGPRPRRDAGRRVRVHLRLPHLRGVKRLVSRRVLGALLGWPAGGAASHCAGRARRCRAARRPPTATGRPRPWWSTG